MSNSKDIAENTNFTSLHKNGLAPKKPILLGKLLTSPESDWATVFFNSSATAFFLMEVNSTGEFVCSAVNDAYLHSTGFSHEQVVGKTPQEILAGDESVLIVGKFNEAIKKKSPIQYETSHIIKGKHIYGLTTVTPIFNEHSECKYIIGSSIDITRQKQVEKDLQLSESKYRILTENIKDVVWVLDAETFYFKYVSPSVERLRGYTVEEVISKPMEASLTPEAAYFVRKRMLETVEQIKTGQISLDHHYTNEVPQPCKDGSIVWTEVITTYYINPETGKIEIRGVTRDITERKKNQLELQENGLRWRSIFENSIDAIGLIHNGKILFANPAFVRLLGYEREDNISGVEILSIFSPDERKKVAMEIAARDSKTKHASHYHSKAIRSNGEVFEIEVNASTYVLGDKVYSIIIIRDITERKEMERNLIHLQTHYQKLIENAPDGIALVNLSGQFTYVSPSSLKMFGYHNIDITKFSPDELTHPEDLPYVLETLQKLILDPKFKPVIQYRFHNSDGSWKWIESTFTNLLAEPTVQAIVINFRDINERKLYELELRRLSTAVEQNPAAICITDTTGSMQYVNKAFEKMTGYTKDEVLGKNPRIMKSGSTPAEKYQELWDTILHGKTWQGELLNKRKNGESYWEEVAISPVMDHNNKILNFVGVKIDIEEKKRTTLALIAAKEKSEEMNRLKSSFLANMSHELRTPMIGILGYSDILEQSDLPDELKQYAGIIHKSGERLMETLNMILDLSRVEAGKLEINLSHVDVWSTIKEICQLFEAVTSRRNIAFTVEEPKERPVVLLDRTMLRHIVNNLLNNAVKFTERGEIRVTLDVDHASLLPQVVLKVSDTGIGIADEDQKLIWDEFRQVSEGKGRSFEGTGLGLSLTKRFVEKLKGAISVQSKIGVGTTFTVRFPLQEYAAPVQELNVPIESVEAINISPDPSNLPTVLYVEDDETAVSLVKYLLKEICELHIAYTPAEALAKVRNNKYAAILMDINLGKDQIDGLQTSILIRQIEGKIDTPIIALTAFAMSGDREEFLSSGCTHYLSKPFTSSEIQNMIRSILST